MSLELALPDLPTLDAPVTTAHLSGREKAAIVVRLLLNEGAIPALTHLPESTQTDLAVQLARMTPVDQATVRGVVQNRLKRHLSILDDLAASPGPFLQGAQVSVLDYYIACMMRWMALYPAAEDRGWFALETTPHLAQRLAWLELRPAVETANTAEGLGTPVFTRPSHPQPPEGSAT